MWETAQFNNRLQVTQLGLGTSPTDTSVWKLNYEFGELDANGNVNAAKNNGNIARQTVTSPVGVYTQSFKYDSLERLKEATETSGGNQTWIQNFTYDRYGNRVGLTQTINGQSSSGTPTVDVNTNRFTTGQGYTYDFAGNIVQDNQGRQFIFNGDNKQVEVRNSQNQIIGQYFYDADGKRIKKVTNDEITVFVYSTGKLVAEYSAVTAGTQTSPTPQTQYYGTDMLQSLRVITNQSGQVVSRRDFMPFGEDIPRANYGSDNNRNKFTTYQKDNETGLDFAEARYYNNAHGRFTAVDPLLASGKSADPQSFNCYVYSLNSPLLLSDPSGMTPEWVKDTSAPEGVNRPIWVSHEEFENGGYELWGRDTYLTKQGVIQLDPMGPASLGDLGTFDGWYLNGVAQYSGLAATATTLGTKQTTEFKALWNFAAATTLPNIIADTPIISGIPQTSLNSLTGGNIPKVPTLEYDGVFGNAYGKGTELTLTIGSFFAGGNFKRSGVSMEGMAYETSPNYLAKHIEGSSKSLNLLKKENIHVFKDFDTLSFVEDAIFKKGEYTGFSGGYHRFGVKFDTPIGTQFNRGGGTIPLFYGEMKVRPNGYYHLIPRRAGPRKSN